MSCLALTAGPNTGWCAQYLDFLLAGSPLWCPAWCVCCCAVQTFLLEGVLLQPTLLVASPEGKLLDFGSVHVAAPRTLELLVNNPTEADAAWQATISQPLPTVPTGSAPAAAPPRPGRDARRAAAAAPAAAAVAGASPFTVVPQQGVLPCRGLGMPRQQRLQVTFAPHHSGPCVGELRLAVAGVRSVSVPLRGVGVHAEGAEPRTAYDL